MSPSIQQEIIKLLLRASLGAALGLLLGNLLLGLLLGVTLYTLMHLRYLFVLRNWFDQPKSQELPEPSGIWGEVFDGLLTLQRRNRKRKKKLALMLAEFKSSTEALPDGAVVLGPQGDILWFNSAASELLGLKNGDIGQRLANLIRHPAFVERAQSASFDGEIEAPSPVNPAVPLALRLVSYGANGQRLLVARDTSALRRVESMRRDFVSNASHELRTPLTVLRGWLDMMAPDAEQGALGPWAEPLRQMQAQTQRMQTLVDDLLKLARLEAGDPLAPKTPVHASRLAQKVIADASAVSAGRHRITANITPELWLLGEEAELHSVFNNLINNAVQYTAEGGEVHLQLGRNRDGGVHYAVRDSGIGIAEKDLPRLTERFYRVDVARSRASGGTGLGLSIVKHALERHESRLEIRSQLGKGSTFFCDFPPHRCRPSEA